MGSFVPDEVFPVKDAVAVHDRETDAVSTTYLLNVRKTKMNSPTRSTSTCPIANT